MKRFELKQIIRAIIEEGVSNDFQKLVTEFKSKLNVSDYKRDNCKSTSYSLQLFMNSRGYNVPIVQGFYKVENPKLVKRDFTKEELADAEKKEYDISNKSDLYNYANESGLLEELSVIPHVWNSYNNEIVDITGEQQFVVSKMTPELKDDNYFTIDEIPNKFTTLKNFY